MGVGEAEKGQGFEVVEVGGKGRGQGVVGQVELSKGRAQGRRGKEGNRDKREVVRDES